MDFPGFVLAAVARLGAAVLVGVVLALLIVWLF